MPSVLWYCWLGVATCKKTVARITYTVLVETLNPAQSINQSVCAMLCYHAATTLPRLVSVPHCVEFIISSDSCWRIHKHWYLSVCVCSYTRCNINKFWCHFRSRYYWPKYNWINFMSWLPVDCLQYQYHSFQWTPSLTKWHTGVCSVPVQDRKWLWASFYRK